ncbi:MAG: GreA/GreB family elongation factor [Treponema sp.]|nr:GreA/GreB family elongation factor [Treponema sp.]
MSEELENSVREMLKAETWTRAGIESFTTNNLNELSMVIDTTHRESAEEAIITICDEQLQKTKDSVSALYIKGMLKLREQVFESKELVSLIDIFEKNHRSQIAEAICDKILEEAPENIFALRKRAEYYKNNDNKEYWDVYKKIVQLDFNEADLAQQLAKHYHDDENNEKDEITYYKRAILRYISTAGESASKNWEKIKTVWSTLVKLIPKEIDYFLMLQKKIAKNISADKSATLMMELYDYYKDTANWDVAINILKLVLNINKKEQSYRNDIVECYRNKYAANSHVEDYIKHSNLNQSFRDVFEAINDFEKHIAFDTGNFVFHRSWGVGYIKGVQGDDLSINFGNKMGSKTMKLDMAIKALQPLSKRHIWVLKATKSKEFLQGMVMGKVDESKKLSKTDKDNVRKNAVAKTLKIIIESFDNRCDMKRIKAELVPAIIEETKWNNWHAIANEILTAGCTSDANSPNFAVAQDDINMYTVRENKLEIQERLNIEFKAEKEFFPKSDILMKLVDQYKKAKDEDKDKYLEPLTDMFNYFLNFLKSTPNDNEKEQMTKWVASFLIVQNISKEFPSFHVPEDFTFEYIYSKINSMERDIYNPKTTYRELQGKKNSNLRDYFLKNIKLIKNWEDEYIKLFSEVANSSQDADRSNAASYIAKELIDSHKEDKLTQLVKESFDDFKNNRNAVIFLFKENNRDDEKDEQEKAYLDSYKKAYQAANISYDKQLQTLISIIDYCSWEISNHKDTPENKKTINSARNLLFGKKMSDKNLILEHILSNDEENALRFFTMVCDIEDLDYEAYKKPLRAGIQKKWPDFKFPVMEVKQQGTQNGIYATAKALEEKKAEADNIEKVILPKIVEEIAEAREKGDLKENAEYISAKEAEHINSKKLADLRKQLERAVVFDPSTLTTAIVSFGTTVTVHDNVADKDVVYTILGPFESAPDEDIISYLSPIGDKLKDHKVGENLNFTINDKKYNYTIKSIEAAKLS